MENKQMTVVEWLQERINIGLTYEQEVLFEGLFEKAKEMEKKQIIDAYICEDNPLQRISAEQYYNETYNK